jgi:hypothetical protein
MVLVVGPGPLFHDRRELHTGISLSGTNAGDGAIRLEATVRKIDGFADVDNSERSIRGVMVAEGVEFMD